MKADCRRSRDQFPCRTSSPVQPPGAEGDRQKPTWHRGQPLVRCIPNYRDSYSASNAREEALVIGVEIAKRTAVTATTNQSIKHV
ncbi:hypothetical protein IG631_02064 [Alternaria alternata]|nr:hypothetical protein IG631_02064 [Alternaria alternata]